MKGTKPYIIAEMGVNFYDTANILNITPLEAAKKYIDAAAEVGIDCAKFQSYKSGTIASKNSPAYWDTTKEPTKTQYELFLKYDHFGERDFTDVKLGFSDNVAPDQTIMILATAYLLGAEIMGKHFTLDKTLPGNDHYHAGDPDNFKKAISNFKWIAMILGRRYKTVLNCELVPIREARRSLVLTRAMKAGEIIKKEDLIPKRSGTGISPIYTDIVVVRKVVKDLEEDTIMQWDLI